MDPAALDRLNSKVRAGAVPIFHGGAPDLRVGDMVLPPKVTGVQSMRLFLEGAGLGTVTTSESLVYVSLRRPLAAAAAAYWPKRDAGNGRGWLYRLELMDADLEPDADFPRGPFVNFQVASARVAAVLDRGVDPEDRRHVRELQSFLATVR